MKKSILKRIISISLVSLFLLPVSYVALEPTLADAVTDNVIVTLTVDAGISISDGAAVTMSPNLSISVMGSIGSSTWTVITNDPDGYTLAVHDSTDPALKNGAVDSFANYTEGTPGTPEQPWTVTSAKEFGFSAFGTDTNTTTWGLAASCGSAGVPSTTQKYMGFLATPTDKTIATRATVTSPSGITTTICFAAEQDGVLAAAGTYTATITGTALVI
ncbi:MAG: hypothetical protein AAB681_01625 [Patescibacteria group bacterium]